jgi:hypothetical protein
MINTVLTLRPGIINPELWYSDCPAKNEWTRIRKEVLERDGNTCQFCSHTAAKYMNVHHISPGRNDSNNLITCCVACHAVLHIGYNIRLHNIEIWNSEISQVEIVQITREGIENGDTLKEIKNRLPISQGEYPPKSIQYANSLIANMGERTRAELDEPLCVIFTGLKRWQVEGWI